MRYFPPSGSFGFKESSGRRAAHVVRDKVSETVGWVLPAMFVTIALVPVAYLLGRFIWSRVEPGDPDPGGRASPSPHGGSLMKGPESPYNAVDLLRILRGGRR